MNHVVWCFTTQGMCTVGQEEIVTALEVSPDESTVPRDIFTHLFNVYEEAGKGTVVFLYVVGGWFSLNIFY